MPEEKKPFNDAMEHLNQIEGYPTNVEMKKLPKPLRFFGYFIFGFFGLTILLMIIMNILEWV